MKVCLLGASFVTGNLGVGALAEASIKLILTRWPDAEIFFLGSGYQPQEYHLSVAGRDVLVRSIPIRFSKNLMHCCHFLKFLLLGLAVNILPGRGLKSKVAGFNPHFKSIYEASLAVDITGGDSMSDIYGFRRFMFGFLCKWLVIFLGKRFILLPQTYGPFKRRLSRIMARYIFSHAETVYSRDQDGIDCVAGLFAGSKKKVQAKLVPDVAFVLDSRRPKHIAVDDVLAGRSQGKMIVGFNISALLYNGGYTGSNMFGLKANYKDTVQAVIGLLLGYENVSVLLVPHVFPPPGWEVESDVMVNSAVYQLIPEPDKNRVLNAISQCTQGEIKYIIGQCDFFIGSRMHACIAALSQGVPAVGIAYSKKFSGVFDVAGVSDCVADARFCDKAQVLEKIDNAFRSRESVHSRLTEIMPAVKQQVSGIFRDLNVI